MAGLKVRGDNVKWTLGKGGGMASAYVERVYDFIWKWIWAALLSSVLPKYQVPSGDMQGHLVGTPGCHLDGYGIICILEKMRAAKQSMSYFLG